MVKDILKVIVLLLTTLSTAFSQTGNIAGKISASGKPLEFANVGLINTTLGAISLSDGSFQLKNIPTGNYKVKVSSIGFISYIQNIMVTSENNPFLKIELQPNESQLSEVVVTGTMKESYKSESPVPVEVITSKFFLKNPTPSIFESIAMVNGVQPQLNCNICNTGDIHINGMEGPYTMITIDGMPIVSSLSTVYGLSGIPNSMVQRVEIVKGPASTLYGSEAVGGLINIITKSPEMSPIIALDVFGTSNYEINNDLSIKANVGNASTLTGINYFKFGNRMDKNKDNFTDVTLQDRLSIFNKWNFKRKEGRLGTLAARYVYEDRWGGEMQWNAEYRGSDSIYGESIYTKRYEIIGAYELPVKEKITFQFSYTDHHQNSTYGKILFVGQQNIAFGQLLLDKNLNKHHGLLVGVPFRYTFYDDNTVGTQGKSQNALLPGIFVQDEIKTSEKLTTLIGIRYDYNSDHGNIFSPRLSLKYSINKNNILRLSGGNGYRVVNLFTEDHAALTGSREVVIKSKLKPEQSYNVNLNYTGFINHNLGFIGLDASIFYTYFNNKITGDFVTDPNKIIYDNLNGYAISRGITLNTDLQFMFPLKITLGATLMDVYQDTVGSNKKIPQLNAPRFSGTFTATYAFNSIGLSIDYTGKVMGPMHLAVQANDFRQTNSPWFTLQNIQVTKRLGAQFQLYGGVKNIFNFIPNNPLMRPEDPFDKRIDINNPNQYTFDTSYNYSQLLGIRSFLGIRYMLK